MEHVCHSIDNAHLKSCGAFVRFTLVCLGCGLPTGNFVQLQAQEAAAAAAPICPPMIIAGVKLKGGRGISQQANIFCGKFFGIFYEGARYL